MKFVINLNVEQTIKLVESKKLYDVYVLPIEDNLKDIVSEFMLDNTGYGDKAVIGISRVFGNEGLVEMWDDLNSFIPMSVGDYLLEFNMPDDACVTMTYNKFLEFNSNKNLVSKEVLDSLNLDSHTDSENEILFCPYIDFKYCKCFMTVGEDWESESTDIKDSKELQKIKLFKK